MEKTLKGGLLYKDLTFTSKEFIEKKKRYEYKYMTQAEVNTEKGLFKFNYKGESIKYSYDRSYNDFMIKIVEAINNISDNARKNNKPSLFTSNIDGKQVLDNGNKIFINLKDKGKYQIEICDNIIKVKQEGALNLINKGLTGEKTYNINNMSGVQFKEPDVTVGYIQFIIMGHEAKGGVKKAIHDENTILFSSKNRELMYELKEYIEWKITNKNDNTSNNQNNVDNLEQIKKLKELLDIGAITNDEFELKKKELLGL